MFPEISSWNTLSISQAPKPSKHKSETTYSRFLQQNSCLTTDLAGNCILCSEEIVIQGNILTSWSSNSTNTQCNNCGDDIKLNLTISPPCKKCDEEISVIGTIPKKQNIECCNKDSYNDDIMLNFTINPSCSNCGSNPTINGSCCDGQFYNKTAGTCESCPNECQNCNSTTGECIKNSTIPCSNLCDDCDDLAGICLSCIDKTKMQPSGDNCVCNEGYFLSGIICQGCGNNCSICNYDGKNITCCDGKFYNKTSEVCEACPKSCLNCNSAEGCNNCEEELRISGEIKRKNTVCCSDGYFLNSSTSLCEKCPNNCIICDKTTGICNDCTEELSISGSIPIKNATCCLDNFYLNGSSCEPCDSNCENCNKNTGICITCKEKMKNDPNNLKNCICSDPYSYFDGSTCQACGNLCVSCNSNGCLSCQNITYLVIDTINAENCICKGNQLYDSLTSSCYCQSGYFDGLNCQDCGSLCSSCSFTICLECKSIEHLEIDQNDPTTCKCKSGFIFVSSLEKCIQSTNQQCDSFCDNCDKGVCLECKSGYFLNITASCQECGTNCSECNNTSCVTCDDPFKMMIDPKNNMNCLCKGNQVLTQGVCQCGEGEWFDSSTCQKCASSCKKCEDETGNCTLCKLASMTINEDQKSCKCKNSEEYWNGSNCISCNNLCSQCDDFTGKCNNCKGELFLDQASSSCVCHDHFYRSGFNCIGCSDNYCQKCAGPNQCSQCTDPVRYVKADGSCDFCPTGKVSKRDGIGCDDCSDRYNYCKKIKDCECPNCPCPSGYYSSNIQTNDCSNKCSDDSCDTCTGPQQCCKCKNPTDYIDGYNCKSCPGNKKSNNDGRTCDNCQISVYPSSGSVSCKDSCAYPLCEMCIKKSDCKECSSIIDLNEDFLCFNVTFPSQNFIIGAWSQEFKVTTNCPSCFSRNLMWNNENHRDLAAIDISNILKSSSTGVGFNLKSYDNYTAFSIKPSPDFDIQKPQLSFSLNISQSSYKWSITPISDDFSKEISKNSGKWLNIIYGKFGKFTVNITSIIINPKLNSCSDIFASSTLSVLGGDIVLCTIDTNTNQTLEVIMDGSRTLPSTLTFKDNVFMESWDSTSGNLRYLTFDVPSPEWPIAIIKAPKEICCNCQLKLDGSESVVYGDKTTFVWTIKQDSTKLYGPVSYFQATNCIDDNSKYDIELTVTDAWNHTNQSPATCTVKVTKNSFSAELISPNETYVNKSAEFSVNYYFSTSEKIVPDIIWTYYPTSNIKSVSTITGKKDIAVVFSEEDLYNITVALAPPKALGYETQTQSALIMAKLDLPKIVVQGVNTTINAKRSFPFYAKFLYSDGSSDIKYSLNISVISCNNGTVIKNDSKNGEFWYKEKDNDDFLCSFAISADPKSKFDSSKIETSCYFNVTKVEVPVVSVTYPPDFYDWSDWIRFTPWMPNQENLICKWVQKSPKDQKVALSTDENQCSYSIAPFVLVPGVTYNFAIQVTDKRDENKRIEIGTTRPVNCPPQNGTFSVQPTEGIALKTEFQIEFNSWQDQERNTPFYYQVLQVTDDTIVAITPKTTQNNFNIMIGKAGTVKLLGRVYDSRGTFQNSTVTLSINPNEESLNLLGIASTLKEDSLKVGGTVFVSKMVAIAQLAYANETDKDSTQAVMSTLLGAFNEWTNKTEMSLSEVNTAVDVLRVFLNKPESLNETLILNIADSLKSVIALAEKIDQGTLTQGIKEVDAISNRTQSLAVTGEGSKTSAEAYELAEEFVKNLTEKYQIDTNANEPQYLITGNYMNTALITLPKKKVSEQLAIEWAANSTVKISVDTELHNDDSRYFVYIVSTSSFNRTESFLQKSDEEFSSTDGCSISENAQMSCSSWSVENTYNYHEPNSPQYVKAGMSKSSDDFLSSRDSLCWDC